MSPISFILLILVGSIVCAESLSVQEPVSMTMASFAAPVASSEKVEEVSMQTMAASALPVSFSFEPLESSVCHVNLGQFFWVAVSLSCLALTAIFSYILSDKQLLAMSLAMSLALSFCLTSSVSLSVCLSVSFHEYVGGLLFGCTFGLFGGYLAGVTYGVCETGVECWLRQKIDLVWLVLRVATGSI